MSTTVGVDLERVRYQRAGVVPVADPVAILIDVAGVAQSIAVGGGLVRVDDGGAVVGGVRERVAETPIGR